MFMITKVNPVASDVDWNHIHIHIHVHMNNKSDIWYSLMTGKQYTDGRSPRRYHIMCMYFDTFETFGDTNALIISCFREELRFLLH